MAKEIDFKRYLSSNVQSVRKALRELIVENCAYEITQVTHVTNTDFERRNFMPSILCIAACELVGGDTNSTLHVGIQQLYIAEDRRGDPQKI